VVYIPCDSNYGVAKGNNIGIKKALEDDCEYILLSNNDIFFDDTNIFQKMIDIHQKDSTKKIISPKVYYFNSNLIWFAGCYFRKLIANPLHIGFQEKDNGQFELPFFCNSGPTCFVMFHNNVFEKVGFMDEKYFVYMDDIDFFYRCEQVGILNYYEPSISIQHKESISTGGRGSDFTYIYTFRNRLYFVNKFFKFPLSIISKSYLILAYGLKSILQNRISIFINTYKNYRNLIKNEA
jgi:GT2 family glycosyltransferase